MDILLWVSLGQGGTVLFLGVVAGPGGHLGVEAEQASQQGLMAAGGGVGAGAQQGDLLHLAQGSSGCQSG